MAPAIPKGIAALLPKFDAAQRNPVLQLDKLGEIGDGNQEDQKKALDMVIRAKGDENLLRRVRDHRRTCLQALTAAQWTCRTAGPLTLHLSRASALENAGICLHPIYGFVYLPGSGLKGMSRVYAETVWLPGQEDQARSWEQIEDVFGWAPNCDRKEQIKNPHHPAHKRFERPGDPKSPESPSCSGSIVFHDAWPVKWPKLHVDIVNCHHREYYDGKGAPGDWEDPVPVYFLAVGKDQKFEFAVSRRRADVPDRLVELAREWLLGALCHLGAGAKTNAGYGCFIPVQEQAPEFITSARQAVFECQLELVTPAFLAGASQKEEDCELRSATLRGQLRWWWRTMHAGHARLKDLRQMESAIWGDASLGGAVRLALLAATEQRSVYSKRDKANMSRADKGSALGILGANPQKTTQGLWYHSYGMDDAGKKRWFVEPGARYTLRLVAREATINGCVADPQAVLQQAACALWLLCRFGGVGAKSRKAFGCFMDQEIAGIDLETCAVSAKQVRVLSNIAASSQQATESPSLAEMLVPLEVQTLWKREDVWFALDQVGFAAQAFAKRYKHNRKKMGLGMPRRIGNPQGQFNAAHDIARHASPVHYHLTSSGDGRLVLRVVAFPVASLDGIASSRSLLRELAEFLKVDLKQRAETNKPPAKGKKPQPAKKASPPKQSGTGTGLKSGQKVPATLLPDKTKKGGWKARHEKSGLSGPIHNTADVPPDKQPGDAVTLEIASVPVSGKELNFRWPKG